MLSAPVLSCVPHSGSPPQKAQGLRQHCPLPAPDHVPAEWEGEVVQRQLHNQAPGIRADADACSYEQDVTRKRDVGKFSGFVYPSGKVRAAGAKHAPCLDFATGQPVCALQEAQEREKTVGKALQLNKAELHDILDLFGIARGAGDEGKKVLPFCIFDLLLLACCMASQALRVRGDDLQSLRRSSK